MFGLGRAHESLPYWAAAREGAKALGGRLLLGEWLAAAEAESLIDAVDPATGLRRAQEALDLSQNTESMIGEAFSRKSDRPRSSSRKKKVRKKLCRIS